jgi:hypothetical protein
MTIRLTCNVDNTPTLLRDILLHTMQGNRVMFLCESGRGNATIQRARVMLSRKRKELERQARKRGHFNLHSTIHPHTEGGKRFDAVVVWRTQSERHRLIESIEDMIGSGAEL